MIKKRYVMKPFVYWDGQKTVETMHETIEFYNDEDESTDNNTTE